MNILDIAIAKKLAGGGGGSGTDNYNDLSNLPKINDTTLSGNKSSSALGLQSEINSDSKLASDLVDDTNQDNKFVTSTEKNTWNAKQNAIDSDHKLSSDLVDDANKTNKFVTSTEKNTWNNKQNAIDADHKLSSSLVSFTTAEAAALASGIDSSKVGQISTNQTNILLVDEMHGGRNECEYNQNMPAWSGITITVASDSVKMSGTTSSAYTGFIYDGANTSQGTLTNLTEDYICVLFGTATGVNINLQWVDATGTHHYDNLASPKTIPTGARKIDGVYIQKQTTTSVAVSVDVNIMLCKKRYYDAGFTDFQPYALPNYDLTYLQAEDRASLAEVVDSGAKNILAPTDLVPYGDGLTNNPNLTCTNNGDGTYTLNGSTVGNGRIIIHHAITSAVYGGKMLSGCPNINTGSEKCRLSIYTDTGASGVCHDAGQGNEIPTSFNPSHLAIYVFSGNTFNNVKFYPMVCTKAAFGVSQKFVPYVPPVVREAIDITSAITTATGYSMINSLSHLYKMGNNVFGELIFKKTSGNFSTDQSFVATINPQYAPKVQFIGIAGFSTSEWSIETIGYAFIQVKTATGGEAGKVMVRDTVTTNNYVHVSVNYVT